VVRLQHHYANVQIHHSRRYQHARALARNRLIRELELGWICVITDALGRCGFALVTSRVERFALVCFEEEVILA
jgi:hypothetical protein